MGTQQPYKTYARGQRIQNSNISFKSGMSFTSAPLAEGYARLLVNFDINSDETTLVPRPGLQTTKKGLCIPSDASYIIPIDSVLSGTLNNAAEAGKISIIAGNRVTHDGIEYEQLIVGKLTAPRNNRTLWYGKAWVITIEGNTFKSYPLHDNGTANADGNRCFFIKYNSETTTIHDCAITNSQFSKSIVGTFAFNSEFYYFTSDGQLRHTKFDTIDKMYKTEVVTPFKPYQTEAQNSLYNMLLKDPYTFDCAEIGSTFRLTGFAPYDTNGKIKISPNVGEEYTYKMYYTRPSSMRYVVFHIEYNSGNNSIYWPISRDERTVYDTYNLEPLIFHNIRVDSTHAEFKITAIPVDPEHLDEAMFNSSGQLTLEALANGAVLPAAYNYVQRDNSDSTTNLETIAYDLSTSKGMCYWKNRIFLFGPEERGVYQNDSTVLIASDPNRPDWFPYSANVDIFDEEIVALQPMLDELLVFTTHNLYSITLKDDGMGWNKKHLQSNLDIKTHDLGLIQVVKNMVFFKSGNYFYMVVPKLTSTSGTGLSVAPITKPIESFLDNFEVNVKQVIDDLYNYSLYTRYHDKAKTEINLQLVHFYNYLDYEDVHNTYLFKATYKKKIGATKTIDPESGDEVFEYTYSQPITTYLNFSLLYNTVSRTWRIYISESGDMLNPVFMNATGKGTYASIVEQEGSACIQFFEYNYTAFYDTYIKHEELEPTNSLLFKNWQYYDSGNLEQNSDMKKRFREYQYKINNSSNSVLEFYTGFFIDRLTRTYEMQYNEEEIAIDEDSLDTGTRVLVVDAVPRHSNTDADTAAEWTRLGSWKLGVSKFPRLNIWKVRIPTSGKGYLPRTVLISYNEHNFELMSHSTVYRQLYSR